MATFTNNEKQAITNDFESILTDSQAMANYLHDNMYNEEREMLLSELYEQGFSTDVNVDTIIKEVPYKITMWSGIPVDEWVDIYINEQGEDFSKQQLQDKDNILDYIMANLHQLEFRFVIEITPHEYKNQFPNDDPSLFIALLENYSFDEVKQLLNIDYYHEQVEPLVREQFVEQGYDIKNFDEPQYEIDYELSDFNFADGFEHIAETLAERAMQNGGVEKYVQSSTFAHDALQESYIDFEIDVEIIDKSNLEVVIDEQLYNQIKNGFIDVFESPEELGNYLKETENHLYQIVTDNALQQEGFPVEANYENTDVVVSVTSKVDSEVWAEGYVLYNDLEEEENDVIQSYAEDRDKMIEYVFGELQQTDISVEVLDELEDWYEMFKKSNPEEASEAFAESEFEIDMIDFDDTFIIGIFKDEYQDEIKDVKRELGTHPFAPDDPEYDAPVDDESYWEYDLEPPQDMTQIETFIKKAIIEDGIVDEDALIEACDDGWAEDKLVEGDFLAVGESADPTSFTYIIEFVPDE